MTPHSIWRLHLTGWLLFSLSAFAFVWDTWRAGDAVGLIASLLFLVACGVFLVPLFAQRPERDAGPD